MARLRHLADAEVSKAAEAANPPRPPNTNKHRRRQGFQAPAGDQPDVVGVVVIQQNRENARTPRPEYKRKCAGASAGGGAVVTQGAPSTSAVMPAARAC